MILAFVLCSIAVLIFLYKIFHDGNSFPKNIPPGPYRLPVLGSTIKLTLLDPDYPHKALGALAKIYGDIMSIGYGVHYFVVFSSYETIKEMLQRSESSGRFIFPWAIDRAFDKPNMGIAWSNGPRWEEIRRFTIKTLRDFGFGKKFSMDFLIQEEASDLIADIKDKIKETGGEWVVDRTKMACTAVNIVWALMTGYRYSPNDCELYEITHINNDIYEALGFKNRYSALPFVKTLFPTWSGSKGHKECYKRMQEFLRKKVVSIKKEREQRADKKAENFIEAFMDEMDERQLVNPDEDVYTEEMFIVVLSELFLGGSETTRGELLWQILTLARYPEVQKKIYEEIETKIGQRPLSILDDVELPYTKAVILECVRMNFASPLPIQRLANEEFVMQGYTIPKGAGLMFNLEPGFRDKNFWGDPDVFRPERFLAKDKSGKVNVVNAERVAFIFGSGRRACPGESVARSTIFLLLTSLVRNFELSFVPGKTPDFTHQPGFSMLPKPYSLQVKCRH